MPPFVTKMPSEMEYGPSHFIPEMRAGMRNKYSSMKNIETCKMLGIKFSPSTLAPLKTKLLNISGVEQCQR